MSITLILIAALAATSFADTRIEILLSASDLPDSDVCCSSPVYPPDAYAIVYYAASGFDSYVKQGETKVLSDNHNPVWSDIFTFNVLEGTAPRIKIDIMDSDVDSDDYIGFAELNLMDLTTAFGKTIEKDLTPRGQGSLTVQARINGTNFANEKLTNMFNNPSRVIQVPSRVSIAKIPVGKY